MTTPKDSVTREFPAIGRYRVRILAQENGNQVLDIREYIQSDTFEGYTRRGIRLAVPQDLTALATILTQLEPAPPTPKPPTKHPAKTKKR
jgi:hypothetical protein